MKIKELLPSLVRMWKLKRTPVASLHGGEDTLPVIVSLTSIRSRLPVIHWSIRSVLNQSHKPEKIQLWLHQDLESSIPPSLRALVGPRLEIHYSRLDCPHLKLLETLTQSPDKIIVTCDDDLMYPESWLLNLYQTHLAYPQDVIANIARLIKIDEQGQPLRYNSWPYIRCALFSDPALMAAGYGGVLYPPKALADQAHNESLFMQLAPRADDLWFKAMSWLANTKVRLSLTPHPDIRPVPGSQRISLKKANVGEDKNRTQWAALAEYFNINLHMEGGVDAQQPPEDCAGNPLEQIFRQQGPHDSESRLT
ncbi:MAG: hypothetical protein ACK4SX_00950 [Alcanivoracaceae bacterium]